jgi:CCR4-NOT transcription complex subunit 7/8
MGNRKGILYIGIDLEYLAHATTDTKLKPFTAEQWYSSLQDYVNNGSVAQIGLALVFEEKDHTEVFTYEINLIVDEENGNFHETALEFLKKHGHNLSKHKEMGILPEWVYAGLLRHLPFGNDNVVWIAYHGDRDIAFFLRLMEGGGEGVQLPSLLGSFCHHFNENFPHYYDVKVLAQLVKQGFNRKLTTLAGADYLNVKRTGGDHHAGCDALLTLQCFGKILQGHKLEGVLSRKGLLSGIEDLQLPITVCRHVTASDVNLVHVHRGNFDQEAAYISRTISSNFNLIGLKVSNLVMTLHYC